MRPLIIGLTGGIACGKSTVSRELSGMGAHIIDADLLAHQLSQPGEAVYQAYLEHFGEEILRENGELDREKVAQLAFGRPTVVAWLNETAHPLIRRRLELDLAKALSPPCQAVVLDVPLLFEAGWDSLADESWLVYAEEKTQLERLLKRDECTLAAAKARIAAQMPLAEKKARADILIDNSGKLTQTQMRLKELWKERVERHGRIS
jgi:dephospho-CoA kinase